MSGTVAKLSRHYRCFCGTGAVVWRGSVDDALEWGRRLVYLAPADEERVRSALANNQIAEWQYGFNVVQIVPHDLAVSSDN